MAVEHRLLIIGGQKERTRPHYMQEFVAITWIKFYAFMRYRVPGSEDIDSFRLECQRKHSDIFESVRRG